MAEITYGLGIDQSLTSTGFAIWQDGKAKYGNIKTTPGPTLIERQMHICKELDKMLDKHKIEYVAMEDYAYGTFGRAAKQAAKLCELGGMIKRHIALRGVLIFVVNTKYVKQWIGVAHNAKKKEVVAAVNEKWGFKFKIKDNDLADALILAEIADACALRLNGLPLAEGTTAFQAGLVEAILNGEDTVLRV